MTQSRKQYWKVLLIPAAVVLAFALWKIPNRQAESYRARFDRFSLDHNAQIQLEKDLITAENNARLTLAQIIGGTVLLVGLYFTWRTVKVSQDNLRVTEEGKLTERFSKAVELLGGESIEARLGGIYALERVARDSEKDHWTVMEVLTAFVRERSIAANPPAPTGGYPSESEWPSGWEASSLQNEPDKAVATDIQAALTVIGRREWVEEEKTRQVLDFSVAALQGADLSGAKLRRANFRGADLTAALLVGADLTEAILFGTNLSGANLTDAKLGGAYMILTTLNKTMLGGADLESAKGLTESQMSVASVDGKTKPPKKFLEE